jgi:hypothetical protein
MHLFPWTRRRARDQAIAEAQHQQQADYDRAVQRIVKASCPFCPDRAQPFLAPGDLADHLQDVHGIGEP